MSKLSPHSIEPPSPTCQAETRRPSFIKATRACYDWEQKLRFPRRLQSAGFKSSIPSCRMRCHIAACIPLGV